MWIVFIVISCGIIYGEKFKLKGGGSTALDPLLTDFASNTNGDYDLTYEPDNSYSGIEWLTTGGDGVIFAGTDIYFPQEETKFMKPGASVMCLPIAVGAIVFVYKYPETYSRDRLSLSQEMVLGLFNKTVSRWQDTLVFDQNPFAPDKPVYLYSRNGYSGTTYAVTKLFSHYSPSFRSHYGPSGKINWNISHTGVISSQSEMLHNVHAHDYSIGYVSFSAVKGNSNPLMHTSWSSVWKPVAQDKLILVSLETIRNAVDSSLLNNITFGRTDYHFPSFVDLKVSYNKQEVYPFITLHHLCFLTNQTRRSAQNIYWMLQDLYSFIPLSSKGLVSIPETLSSQSLKIFKHNVTCDGGPCFEDAWTFTRLVLQIALVFLFFFAFVGICIILSGYFNRKKWGTRASVRSQIGFDRGNNIMSTRVVNTSHSVNLKDLVLEEQIGSGSFSEVYRGKWLGTPVAIKRFLVSKTNVDVFSDFQKEAKMLSALRHPNILQFLGTHVTRTHLYIITEYCGRGNLQDIIRDKGVRLTPRKIVSFALDAAKGMQYLHSLHPPILHRDFKTSNLLVGKNWSIKIGDFGLSRILDRKEEMSTCGTVETCAPEILSCQAYTEKADVYSFGIVMYEMLTRKELFPGLNFFEISKKVVDEKYRPNIELLPDFPTDNQKEEVASLIESCWHHNPIDRPHFGVIVQKLHAVYESLDTLARQKSMSIKGGKEIQGGKIVIADSFEKESMIDRYTERHFMPSEERYINFTGENYEETQNHMASPLLNDDDEFSSDEQDSEAEDDV